MDDLIGMKMRIAAVCCSLVRKICVNNGILHDCFVDYKGLNQTVDGVWGWLDSNQRIPKKRDLQSLAIGRYATPPKKKSEDCYTF